MIMADDEDMIALIVLIVHTSSSNDTHKISLNGRDGTCCTSSVAGGEFRNHGASGGSGAYWGLVHALWGSSSPCSMEGARATH